MAESHGTPREEFLQSVRLALGREPGPPHPLYHHLEQTLPELEAQVRPYVVGAYRGEREALVFNFRALAHDQQFLDVAI